MVGPWSCEVSVSQCRVIGGQVSGSGWMGGGILSLKQGWGDWMGVLGVTENGDI